MFFYPHPDLPPGGKVTISPLGETGKGVNEITLEVTVCERFNNITHFNFTDLLSTNDSYNTD
jgi:hypothetical protein